MTNVPPRSAKSGPTRVLWVMQHAGFVRYFESAIEALAAGGHQVRVVLEEPRNKLDERTAADELVARLPGVTLEDMPPIPETRSRAYAQALRAIRDTLRYRGREYDAAPEMRARSERFVPASVLGLVRIVALGGRAAVSLGDRLCAAVDHAFPPHPFFARFLEGTGADVVVATPSVNFGSDQSDILRAAAGLGMRTAAAVPSWDNLTTKGRLAWVPDRVLVWNAAQVEEAVTLHGVPRERVAPCGAPVFDHWFDWEPSRDREAFCREVGLDPARAYVLYLGSSLFLAPYESEFVAEWVTELRAARDPALARAGVLIRPHPTNTQQWNSAGLELFPGLAIWPARPGNPSTLAFRQDFFDSLFHAAAVVGVNTSAQIEAAILRRPVLAAPVVEQTRFGARTLHFAHLAGGGEPMAWTAPDWETHFEQLKTALGTPGVADQRSDRFVARFVRPHGRDRTAGSVVAGALLDLAVAPLAANASPTPAAWFVRALAWGPGAPLVWLFAHHTIPAWTLALRTLFAGVVGVAAPAYRIVEAAGGWKAQVRRRWRDRLVHRAVRHRRTPGPGASAGRAARRSWRAVSRQTERMPKRIARGWRVARRESSRTASRGLKRVRRDSSRVARALARLGARLLRARAEP
ncbi:MAG: hypothetical protein FJW23_02805 [Acidimicrobiia bacterium]|nr:hypothetical protein [Acidimicrobiia bacterium]